MENFMQPLSCEQRLYETVTTILTMEETATKLSVYPPPITAHENSQGESPQPPPWRLPQTDYPLITCAFYISSAQLANY